MLDWNDVRYFIAVAKTGSTLAAGRSLHVSQTTVARRITALEQAMEIALFERRPAGYRLTETGQALLPRAEAIRAAVDGFAGAAAAQAREISGTVRLTTHDIFAVTVLVPILRDLHHAFPAIRVELETSEAIVDLAAGGADVALRSSSQAITGDLVGRRVAYDEWTVYCSRAYAAAHGQPQSRADMPGHAFIGGGGDGVWRPYREWLKKNGLEGAVAMHHSSATGLLAAVRAGFGLAVLPSFVADQEPDLLRCLPPPRRQSRELWLLAPERLRHTPRVRAVLDFLTPRLAELARKGSERAIGRPPTA